MQYGFPISRYEFAWIGSAISLGCLLVSPFYGWSVKTFGRKRMLMIFWLPSALGYIVTSFAQNVTTMVLGRILSGMGVGGYTVAVPLYTAEIAETHIRGKLGVFFQFMIVSGVLFSYIIGSLLSVFSLSIICSSIPVLHALLVMFIPESPIYYLEQNKEKEARKSLQWFRGGDYNIDEEFSVKKKYIEEIKAAQLPLCEAFSTRAAKRGLVICLGLMAIRHFCGATGIIFYNTTIFEVRSVIKKSSKVTMSETDSLDVMTEKLNPLTGEYAWVNQGKDYDFHQEIARSAFADMLHDSERNEKYYEAIKLAIEKKHREGKQAHVLDIGTGTGLLAMMAARCGADTIYACEAFAPISKCAEKVIKENGLDDQITVIHKRSTSLTVGDQNLGWQGDIPQRCNILVTEVFDTELIGEGAIATFNHAHKVLLEKDCLVVPSRGTVYAQVVESEWMQRWNKLTQWGDVVPSEAILQCPGAAAVHDLQLSQLRREDFTAITTPEPVFRFDWTGRTGQILEDDSSSVVTKAVASGTAQMVFMWWSLDMDSEGEVILSCAPWWAHPAKPSGPEAIPWRDHWMQAVYYLPSPIPVHQGQTLKLLSNHDEFSLWFNLCTSEGPDAAQTERPVCDCMLHVTCSRTRIGMLNDPTRREKYLKVLRNLVTPESVVVSFGDTSLLGLLAATLGASKVYHIEDNLQSLEVMEGLIRDNNLRSKVVLLRDWRHLDEQITSSVNLVVGEPYFMTALCPWHIVRWWLVKNLCPNAVGMPTSASLYIMPMQFDHLHKIRSPLGIISGFKMTPFDKLVQGSSAISDSSVEVHPLWEYPGVCLAQPKEVQSLGGSLHNSGFYSSGNMPFDVPGTWNGMALWVDIHLDADTTVSTGPMEPPIPGTPVHWDPYTRQAVYFMLPEVQVTAKNFLQYEVTFDKRKKDDIEFKFNLQNDHFTLPPKKEV